MTRLPDSRVAGFSFREIAIMSIYCAAVFVHPLQYPFQLVSFLVLPFETCHMVHIRLLQHFDGLSTCCLDPTALSLPMAALKSPAYKADDYGYVVDVKYEGEAKPNENKPAYKTAYPAVEPAYS